VGDWAAAYAKAIAFVGQLTPTEKWNLTAGMRGNNICSGNINAIPRLNFPGLCVSDAGNGLVCLDNAMIEGICTDIDLEKYRLCLWLPFGPSCGS
jgi:hypothetical protein